VPFHLQFYSRQSLKLLAQKSGMKINFITTITESRLFVTQLGLLFLPQEQQSRYYLRSYKMSSAHSIRDWKVSGYQILIKSRIFAPLMRLIDTTGYGSVFVISMSKLP
jgi:hypothetical protein